MFMQRRPLFSSARDTVQYDVVIHRPGSSHPAEVITTNRAEKADRIRRDAEKEAYTNVTVIARRVPAKTRRNH